MKKSLLIPIAIVFFMFNIGTATASEWRFPVGLAYTSGVKDVIDHFEDNLRATGFTTEKVAEVPIGVSFQPYYEFDSGMGIGFGFGPSTVITGDVDFFNLPVNFCLRYTIAPESSNAVYIKAGISGNIASGDYVENTQTGFLGALGVEFMREKAVGFGFEVGYASSTIEFEDETTPDTGDTKDISPVGLMLSIFPVF